MTDMKAVPVKYNTIHMQGGLDLITPTLNLKPGLCRASVNYEASTTGGYSRIAGYERLDGRTAPSAATFTILTVSGSTLPAIGSTITGNTSGATAVLIAQTASAFVVTKVTGTFNGTEVLKVSGTTVGTQTGFSGAGTPKLVAQYKALAADNYRADILKPTGAGAALGAFSFGASDTKFCFRNNAGATAAAMFASSTAGWIPVTLGKEVYFTAASTTPAEGATVSQSGATCIVNRVVLESGSYSAGTAAGRLIVTAMSGTFTNTAFSTGFSATCTTSASQITLLPSGKYEFVTANFAGAASTSRVYGCDGVNRGFEFDGIVFVPINTGASPDVPRHLVAHKNHLLWAIRSSLIHSVPGLPYNYSGTTAGEIATGADITGILRMPGAQTTATMAVFHLDTTKMLYGTGASTWNLVDYNNGTGAYEYSVQNMAQTYSLDDIGVVSLQATLNFGNFDSNTLTQNVRPWLVAVRGLLNCSVLARVKNQYRMYFSNGQGLYLTIVNGEYFGAMPVYFPNAINNAWEGMLTTGEGIILGCGADGYVYQMEKGTSFDGANIGASFTLQFNHMNSPRILNRYRKLALEMIGTSYAEVAFSYTLGYGKTEYQDPSPGTYTTNMLVSNWDLSNWDTFFWDASGLIPLECEMTGTAENVALTFASNNNYADSFTINSGIIHHSPRRGLR